jgi:hypothetical protein
VASAGRPRADCGRSSGPSSPTSGGPCRACDTGSGGAAACAASASRARAAARSARPHGAPVAARLGDIPVDARDPGLRHAERAVPGVVVRDDECDLLGRPEPREEPELVIVSLGFAPIPMERRNEPLGFPDAERVDHRPVLLADASALEGLRQGRASPGNPDIRIQTRAVTH